MLKIDVFLIQCNIFSTIWHRTCSSLTLFVVFLWYLSYFSPKYEFKFNIFILWIPSKIGLGQQATIRDSTVCQIPILVIIYEFTLLITLPSGSSTFIILVLDRITLGQATAEGEFTSSVSEISKRTLAHGVSLPKWRNKVLPSVFPNWI